MSWEVKIITHTDVMVTFPDNPEFEGMPKNGEDRRFMAMPAYLGGSFQMAGMKWYGQISRIKRKDCRVPFL